MLTNVLLLKLKSNNLYFNPGDNIQADLFDQKKPSGFYRKAFHLFH